MRLEAQTVHRPHDPSVQFRADMRLAVHDAADAADGYAGMGCDVADGGTCRLAWRNDIAGLPRVVSGESCRNPSASWKRYTRGRPIKINLEHSIRQSMETFPKVRGSRRPHLSFPRQQAGRMAAGRKRDRGMMRRVEGKVALVTGAANGIGRSAALLLAREGAKIVATDLQDEKGADLLRELRAIGCKAEYYHHDVTREEDWQSVVAQVRAGSAGWTFSSTMPGSASRAPWLTLLRRLEAAGGRQSRRCLPRRKASLPPDARGRRRKHHQRFLDCGIKASPNVSGYCATKGGVRLFTKSVALECAAAKDGVRVNSLHPGVTESAIWDTLIGTVEEGSNGPARGPTLDKLTARAVPSASRPRRRYRQRILWLASDESR